MEKTQEEGIWDLEAVFLCKLWLSDFIKYVYQIYYFESLLLDLCTVAQPAMYLNSTLSSLSLYQKSSSNMHIELF